MAETYINPFLIYLLWVEDYIIQWDIDVDQVQACISDTRFLNMSLWWFERWDKDDSGEENLKNLKSMLGTIESMWERLVGVLDETLDEFQVGDDRRERTVTFREVFSSNFRERTEGKFSYYAGEGVLHDWDLWSPHFERTIEECKLRIRGYCPNLLNCTFNYSYAPRADWIIKFLDDVLWKLKSLSRCIDDEIVPVKTHSDVAGSEQTPGLELAGRIRVVTVPLNKQVESLEEKLMLVKAFFKLIPDDCTLELIDFKKGLYNDINRVAWLTFFFWAKAGDEDIAAELNLMLSDMSQKIIKPSVPVVSSWYFGVLKAMRLQESDDTLLLGQAVTCFLDLLFKNQGIPSNDDFQILRDGLIILFTFLATPPKEHAQDEGFQILPELICIRDELGDLLCQGSHMDFSEEEWKSCYSFPDFVTKIERLTGKIRMFRNLIPDLSCLSFPRPNGLGFIDFLLQNLKENLNSDKMLIPFAKHLIIKIEQELVSMRPDLDNIFELQKGQKEIQDTWLQLINLAYHTEHIVNSCCVILYPIWYNMISLADILDEIKVIKQKLDIVKHSNLGIAAVLPNVEIPARPQYSGANEVMVGLKEEVDTIVDQLRPGLKSLEILVVVGMGGSGKTTLARKVYNTQQVRSGFHIFAFCTVSQVYSTRKILCDILSEIKVVVDDISSKTDDDLGHLLRKQLSRRRYLVVLDDIWNIDAWHKVKGSFPDDKEGSIVIFTTREREVAKIAKSKVHFKHLLSDEESWELLQTMAFPQADCPPDLSEVGQVVARNCGGLPLAVEVIGRLLARKETSLTLWKEIAEKTSSFATEEGCMEMLELSYKHLPERLKSCFLYLGVFAEDTLIPRKKLMLLWIAEGFVQKSQRDSVEIVAKKYLTELVDRSLVHVAKRSSDNGIKTCQLHDIVCDFCRRKARDENIFQLIDEIPACNFSRSKRYRLSIHMDWESLVNVELRDPGIKSLLFNHMWESRVSRRWDGNIFWIWKMSLVQVLDLENITLMGGKAKLVTMTSLVHLRYLAVRFSEGFVIPSSIANLKNLQTFILGGGMHSRFFIWWGETLWKMRRLRHVDLGWVSLYHQSKLESVTPLENVECFSILYITPGTATTLLQKLPNIRELSCHVIPDRHDLALDVLTKLESLKVSYLYCHVHTIFPASLKKLSLNGGKGLFSQIGKLPHLEVLKIKYYNSDVHRWDTEEGEFPELKLLKLKFPNLRVWNPLDGSFPRLEKLVLHDCRSLAEIPASFQESTTLKMIEVCRSSSSLSRSACKVQEELKELGNEIKLILDHFELLIPDPIKYDDELRDEDEPFILDLINYEDDQSCSKRPILPR